jgi:hypothetical protein
VLEDPKTLKLVAEAIAKEPKLKGVTVFQKQEAQAYDTVTETVLKDLAKLPLSAAEIAALLEHVATLVIGKFSIPNGGTDQLKAAFGIIRKNGLFETE